MTHHIAYFLETTASSRTKHCEKSDADCRTTNGSSVQLQSKAAVFSCPLLNALLPPKRLFKGLLWLGSGVMPKARVMKACLRLCCCWEVLRPRGGGMVGGSWVVGACPWRGPQVSVTALDGWQGILTLCRPTVRVHGRTLCALAVAVWAPAQSLGSSFTTLKEPRLCCQSLLLPEDPAWTTTGVLFRPGVFSVLDFSYRWNQTLCGHCVRLLSLSAVFVSRAHPHRCSHLLMAGDTTCMEMLPSVLPWVSGCTVGFPHFLATVDDAVVLPHTQRVW